MKIPYENNNNRITYTGLKSIEYSGLFCPRRNLKDAQSVKYFLESKAFKKLFENYDVKAKFLSTRLESKQTIFNNLYLFCQKIEPRKNMHSQKKSFIERIKSLFNIKSKNTNNKTLAIQICNDSNNFHDEIKNTTWQKLENLLEYSEQNLKASQKESEEIQKIINTTGNWI